MARKNIQYNIEDKAFLSLIKRYTRKRDWEMVEALFFDYGRILLDRELEEVTQ
jgi:hypothetical protein